jgi:arabinan endo-1,5-alpha-L-arabinosidase
MSRMSLIAAFLAMVASPVLGLDGQVGIHDPSTVIVCDGKYYVYATGNGIPIAESDDGWTWRREGSVLSNLPGGRPSREVLNYAGGNNGTNAWAPDVIRVNDNYFLYYALSGANHRAVVALVTNKTLDPTSPEYKWEDGGPIAWSLGDGVEDLHAIDPGVFRDPNDGTLWLVYGSYFGTIRLAQLDPSTGKRLRDEQSRLIVANNSEASELIYHDGWYYLFTNHGTCCSGANSTYNIRAGRSRKITGPYLDDHDLDMARSGGKLFAAAADRKIGPGHFGLLDLGDGVQKFSCHYEADLDHQGQSVLDIRPLLWRDDWPGAGENLKEGVYQVMSMHAGTVLELAVQGIPVARVRRRGGAAPASAPSVPLAEQTAAQVSHNWPAGNVDVRMAPYLLEAQQKWTIMPVADSGGYPGSPYFKITVTGTDRALAATDDDELVSTPSFTGREEQLWRLDELADGSYRICPRSARAVQEKLALTSIGRSTITLAPFSAGNDNQQWLLRHP